MPEHISRANDEPDNDETLSGKQYSDDRVDNLLARPTTPSMYRKHRAVAAVHLRLARRHELGAQTACNFGHIHLALISKFESMVS